MTLRTKKKLKYLGLAALIWTGLFLLLMIVGFIFTSPEEPDGKGSLVGESSICSGWNGTYYCSAAEAIIDKGQDIIFVFILLVIAPFSLISEIPNLILYPSTLLSSLLFVLLLSPETSILLIWVALLKRDDWREKKKNVAK